MDLEQLHQLEAIARLGTMSAAAAELHVSQPSLSKSMKRLERELGCELFTRTPNHAELNEAGRITLDHAHTILGQERLLRDDLDALARRERTLRVVTVAPAPAWRLTAYTVERFPGTLLSPDLMAEKDAEAALINRECDLTILLRPLQLPGMRSCPFMTEDLYLNAPADHPLATAGSVSFSQLNGLTFLIFEQIGFWMDMTRRNLPDSQLIVQKDRTIFQQLLTTSDLCGFATDAPEDIGTDPRRIRVPISDAEAHATFFLCVRDDAPERARQIWEWVEEKTGGR